MPLGYGRQQNERADLQFCLSRRADQAHDSPRDLKAIAIPGYQVPFASREMPMPYGWGTGGVQVTAAILGIDDTLKVIDQGSDDTTNAISIRKFFEKTAGVKTTTVTSDATVIQTRHRIPETALNDSQVLVYQVPIPEPLRFSSRVKLKRAVCMRLASMA
jgi:alpha-D-ribose 1-methylphosphonate 5-phosphate C-P lyase